MERGEKKKKGEGNQDRKERMKSGKHLTIGSLELT